MRSCLVTLDKHIDELTAIIEPNLPPTITLKGGKVTKQELFTALGIDKKVPTKYVEKEVKGELKIYPVKDWAKPVTKWLTEKTVKQYRVELPPEYVQPDKVFDKLKDARDFAKESYPKIKAKYPSTEITVTGYTSHTEDHFGDTLHAIKL